MNYLQYVYSIQHSLFTVLAAAIVCLATVTAAQAQTEPKASLKPKSSRNAPSRLKTGSIELNLQGLRLVQRREFIAAEEIFKKSLESDSRNITAAYNLASAYIINKKEEEAINLLNQYVVKAPADAGLLMRLGDAYYSKRDLSSAQQTYQKVYELESNIPEILPKLAAIAMLANDWKSAERYLVEQIEKNPKDGKSLANLSNAYLNNGKTDEAIATAKKALQFKADKDVYITLASGYEMQNDFKNALIAYQRAVDLGEDSAEVALKIEKFKKAEL